MNNKNQSSKSVIFDTLFIMILCFATLLTTMILQGGVIIGGEAGMNYQIKLPSFIITMGGLLVYIIFILKISNRELKKMIEIIYSKKKLKKIN